MRLLTRVVGVTFALLCCLSLSFAFAEQSTKEDKDINHFLTVRTHIMGSHTWDTATQLIISNRRIMLDGDPVSRVFVLDAQSPGTARGVLSWDSEAGPHPLGSQ